MMQEFIRSTAKALVVHEGKVLLNRSHDQWNGDYYSLPGGGQNRFEMMEDAVRREVLEETGYAVRPVRLLAVSEEIWDDPELREKHPKYAHRIAHIFLCALENPARQEATEPDFGVVETEWVPLEKVDALLLEPRALTGKVSALLSGEAPVFLGSHHILPKEPV